MPGTLKRTYSAPAARAKRAAAASKIQKLARRSGFGAKRKAAVKSKAAKQAYTIATNAVMDMREEKYFHVNGDSTSHPEAPSTGPKRVSVMAFATTSNLDPSNPTVVETYCGHAVKNLNMLRPYKSDGADEKLVPYAIDGKHVFPTANSVSWQIDRNWANLGPTDSTSPTTTAMGNLVDQAVVRCRMIRVTPKLAPGVTTAIAPTDDLFLDQRGLEYSPTDAAFSYSDAEFAAVNRRKYTVLQDTKFNINQPFTQSWTSRALSGSDNVRLAHIVPNPRGSSSKKMVTRHQLSAKKGGSVYYQEPDAAATQNASSGHRREYIFFHFWFQSIDGGGATGTLPDLGGTGVVPDVDVVTAHWRAESRFKEA